MLLEDAAKQGVYGHGLAADYSTKEEGERGLLATDLLPFLRKWSNALI
jgi:NAD(P)H-hydrate epimerase